LINIDLKGYELFLLNLGMKKASDYGTLISNIARVPQKTPTAIPYTTEMLSMSMLNNVSDDDIIDKYFRRYYDRYESWMPALCMQDQVAILSQLIKVLPGAERILDVGCGTCHVYTYLKTIGELMLANITGLDGTEEILEEGRQIAEKNGVELNLVNSRMPLLEEAIGLYDFVSAIDSLHWNKSWRQTVPRMCELLAPKGKLFIVYSEYSARAQINLPDLRNLLKKAKMKNVDLSTFAAPVSFSPRIFVTAEKCG